MGKGKLWHPADQKPPNRSSPNLIHVIMSWVPINKQNLNAIRPGVSSPHIREIYTLCSHVYYKVRRDRKSRERQFPFDRNFDYTPCTYSSRKLSMQESTKETDSGNRGSPSGDANHRYFNSSAKSRQTVNTVRVKARDVFTSPCYRRSYEPHGRRPKLNWQSNLMRYEARQRKQDANDDSEDKKSHLQLEVKVPTWPLKTILEKAAISGSRDPEFFCVKCRQLQNGLRFKL